METYAAVIVSLKSPEVDRIFDYRVPSALQEIMPGLRVIVPFGGRNSKVEGYVVGVSHETSVPLDKIKNIYQVLDDGQALFTTEMLALANWMKVQCFCTLSQCLQAIMPAGLKTKSNFVVQLKAYEATLLLTEQEKHLLEVLNTMRQPTAVQALSELYGQDPWPLIMALKEKDVLRLWQKTQGSEYKLQEKVLRLNKEDEAFLALFEKIKQDKRLLGQQQIIEYLLDGREISKMALKKALGVTDSPIQTLIKKGILQEQIYDKKRDVLQSYRETAATENFVPTIEQGEVLAILRDEGKKEQKRPVLIHGVTGSGKTEIYMQIIGDALRENKQAIVLVPEISLTPQLVERFVSRFGSLVTATHSRMSHGERYDQWRKARELEVSIMIGPRSALFTPFPNLGVLVIDEEHENSYRSDVTPKYDARATAEELCRLTGSLLIFGSATPDISTYDKAVSGKYRLATLKKRTNAGRLPKMIVTDMRLELEEGNRSIFSRGLFEAITENLKNKEQTILFLNRRGYATFVSCRKCGHVMTCDACSVSYTYHSHENELCCHYCGKKIENPKICPACGSTYIKYFGVGTQKVEEEVRKLFPNAGVVRMDMDTTTGKHSHRLLLEEFGKGRADILIGTQMIAKGHDFANVTLVGIVAADLSLYQNTYHAAETSYQLITQAAGRAGRGELLGRVFIQTYQPSHYSIRCAAAQNYEGFYEEEISLRKQMQYPPYACLFTVLLSGLDEKEVIDAAHSLGQIMESYNRKGRFLILGPTPAALSKLKNEYRWRILVKCLEEEPLRNFGIYCTEKWKQQKKWRAVILNLTMNPLTIV